MKSLSVTAAFHKVSPMRGACRSGPCITGGVSPSLHPALQSVTGPIFTGRPQPTCHDFREEFQELKSRQVGGAASSGSPQSQDPTKACRRAPLAFSKLDFPTQRDRSLSHGVRAGMGASRHPLLIREGKKCGAAILGNHRVSFPLGITRTSEFASHRGAKRGALRRGPCITGGVSPSLHPALQSVTGPIFTGRPQPTCRDFREESQELKSRQVGGAASSGSPQSQDSTKAIRRAPLAFSQASDQETP
jgi:hypothetical protein